MNLKTDLFDHRCRRLYWCRNRPAFCQRWVSHRYGSPPGQKSCASYRPNRNSWWQRAGFHHGMLAKKRLQPKCLPTLKKRLVQSKFVSSMLVVMYFFLFWKQPSEFSARSGKCVLTRLFCLDARPQNIWSCGKKVLSFSPEPPLRCGAAWDMLPLPRVNLPAGVSTVNGPRAWAKKHPRSTPHY